jgi:hypothetical protein
MIRAWDIRKTKGSGREREKGKCPLASHTTITRGRHASDGRLRSEGARKASTMKRRAEEQLNMLREDADGTNLVVAAALKQSTSALLRRVL